ncbi:MAG: hypothetical protein ACYS26_07030 [Planctomycetota bacterium]|jgi:hypothetical protein
MEFLILLLLFFVFLRQGKLLWAAQLQVAEQRMRSLAESPQGQFAFGLLRGEGQRVHVPLEYQSIAGTEHLVADASWLVASIDPRLEPADLTPAARAARAAFDEVGWHLEDLGMSVSNGQMKSAALEPWRRTLQAIARPWFLPEANRQGMIAYLENRGRSKAIYLFVVLKFE